MEVRAVSFNANVPESGVVNKNCLGAHEETKLIAIATFHSGADPLITTIDPGGILGANRKPSLGISRESEVISKYTGDMFTVLRY